MPALGEFLDRRMIQCPHLLTKGVTKAAIKLEKRTSFWVKEADEQTEIFYGSMIADVWQDKGKLK